MNFTHGYDMERAQLPLNALRAFEVVARHLNFTRAAIELCVSQGAVSHHVAALERRLGARLFHRLPRGLALTDDGQALVPVLVEAFNRMGSVLDQYADGRFREVLNIGVVGTFAKGWLLQRLHRFALACPHIDLRVSTNNNRVDIAVEGLDFAIRFGDGAWHGTSAEPLFEVGLTALCAPAIASRLSSPLDLTQEQLLRSYRPDEWRQWFKAAGAAEPLLCGPVFDSSALMVAAAINGLGVALAPAVMFTRDLAAERLVRPFQVEVNAGRYWLTRLFSRKESDAMLSFRGWLTEEIAGDADLDS